MAFDKIWQLFLLKHRSSYERMANPIFKGQNTTAPSVKIRNMNKHLWSKGTQSPLPWHPFQNASITCPGTLLQSPRYPQRSLPDSQQTFSGHWSDDLNHQEQSRTTHYYSNTLHCLGNYNRNSRTRKSGTWYNTGKAKIKTICLLLILLYNQEGQEILIRKMHQNP